MPRRMQIAAALYEPNPDGTPRQYGPFQLNQFTNANTDALAITASVEPDWPNDTGIHLFRVRAEWDTGDAAEWIVHGGLRNRDGTPATSITLRVEVPREGNQSRKAGVAAGNVTMWALHPFTTAFTIEAV